MTTQDEELSRVQNTIGTAIMEFMDEMKPGDTFHADELHTWVQDTCENVVAPASADRVLRNLRQQGWLNYRVLDRRSSLYEACAL